MFSLLGIQFSEIEVEFDIALIICGVNWVEPKNISQLILCIISLEFYNGVRNTTLHFYFQTVHCFSFSFLTVAL